MRQMAVLTLTLIMATSQALPAIEKHSAAYAGGTIARLNARGGSIAGRIDTSDPDHLVFVADERPLGTMLHPVHTHLSNSAAMRLIRPAPSRVAHSP
jgi:hypothetical protein